jgi:hypothetical protein
MKDLNVFIRVYKFHDVGVLSHDPCQQINSTALILTNLKLRFEPCMLNLI